MKRGKIRFNPEKERMNRWYFQRKKREVDRILERKNMDS